MLQIIETYPLSKSDRQFFTQLYLQHETLLYAIVGRYITDTTQKQDVVQESVCKLLKKISTLRTLERCTLTAYLVYTVRNTAINYCKRAKLQTVPFEEDQMASERLPLEDAFILQEQGANLHKVLHRLPEEYQIVLYGKYILGDSTAELAHQLRCSTAGVRMKLTRARRKALELLKEEMFYD